MPITLPWKPHISMQRPTQEELPAGLQVLRVRSGAAVLGERGLFEAKLTLVPAPEPEAVLQRHGASSVLAPSPAPSDAAATASVDQRVRKSH